MSPPTLRPYQRALISDIEQAWARGARTPVAVLPCGGGKTTVFSDIIARNEGPSCLIAHRTELVGSASLTLARYGIRHAVIGSTATKRAIAAEHVLELGQCYLTPGSRTVVASVDTLVRTKGLESWAASVTLWVVDEGHHLVTGGNDPITGVKQGNKWHRAVQLFSHARARGLLPTATPTRADGRGLGLHADGLADCLIEGPSQRELIEDGYLTDYRIWCPTTHIETMTAVTASGDYSPVDLKRTSQRSEITGDVVKSYLQFANGLSNLTFTTDVETAHRMAENYRAAGVSAIAITGETDPTIRRNAFKRLERGDIKVAVTVDIIGEGTDIPCVQSITRGRWTQSYQVWKQQWGRGDRPLWGPQGEPATRAARLATIAASTKPWCVYIDHTGGFADPALGPPDRERIWTLDRRDKGAKAVSDAIPLRACLSCYQPFPRNLDACQWCGVPIPPPTARGTPAQVDGDLAELDPAVLALLRGAVAAVDRTIDEERQRLTATGLPDLYVRSNVKHHAARQEAQTALREAMARFGGALHAQGRSDREIQRTFWMRTGVSVVEAMALGASDATALRERLDGAVSSA